MADCFVHTRNENLIHGGVEVSACVLHLCYCLFVFLSLRGVCHGANDVSLFVSWVVLPHSLSPQWLVYKILFPFSAEMSSSPRHRLPHSPSRLPYSLRLVLLCTLFSLCLHSGWTCSLCWSEFTVQLDQFLRGELERCVGQPLLNRSESLVLGVLTPHSTTSARFLLFTKRVYCVRWVFGLQSCAFLVFSRLVCNGSERR
jgi:hypothetical protein